MKAPFYWLLILLWCLLCAFIFAPLQVQTDTASFLNAIDILAGEATAQADRLMRLSKPLSLIFPSFLLALGIAAPTALIVQQYLALMLALWAMYRLYTQFYFFPKDLVYKTLLLYLSSSVIMVHAYAALNDMPAWALTWCLILYSHKIQLYKQPFWHYVLWGSIAAMGMFIKESVLVAGVYIFLALLLNKNKSFLQKTKIYITIAIPFFLLLALGMYWTKIQWGYNLWDWMQFNNEDKSTLYGGENWLKLYLVHFIRLFDVFWFFLLGLVFLRKGIWHLDYIYAIGAAFLFLIYPFLWSYMLERIMFMFAPFYLYFLTLGQYSLSQKNKTSTQFLFYMAMLANLLATYGTYIGHWAHTLWIIYAIYFALFLIIKIGMARKPIPM